MPDRYDLISCAKRLVTVFLGRTEPSVEAVQVAARDVVALATPITLRSVYEEALREPAPEPFLRLLDNLERGARRASH